MFPVEKVLNVSNWRLIKTWKPRTSGRNLDHLLNVHQMNSIVFYMENLRDIMKPTTSNIYGGQGSINVILVSLSREYFGHFTGVPDTGSVGHIEGLQMISDTDHK